MSEANVEFVEGLFTASAGMYKQALVAARRELIAQTCDGWSSPRMGEIDGVSSYL
jgi:hypothetical protein